MPIREFFHLMQIVDDFDQTELQYRRLLAPETFAPKHWSDFDKRWASLAVIGPDFVLEIMEPSKASADLDAPLPKFRTRHGEHWHSMAWFVDPDDIPSLADTMRQSGVRVFAPYGSLEASGPGPRTFFTHPKDTFGQMPFQALYADTQRDPHVQASWTGAYWLDEHPLGIERTSHITTIVSDLDRACALYSDLLSAPPFHLEETADRRSAFTMVGTESVVELAEPKSPDSRLGRDLADHGELPHAVTFKVRDLDAAVAHVGAAGMAILQRDKETAMVNPTDLSNAIVSFTTRALPNDPRQ